MQESKSVLGTLCSNYDFFFDAEKKIADCILERKEEVIDMTVAELAQASGTSDATVSRFCRRCGFKGFHHLKITLTRELAEGQGNGIQAYNDIDRADLGQALQNILANKVEELKQTDAMMDVNNLERILRALEHARVVDFVAVGNTIPVAMDAAYKFNQVGILATAGPVIETQMSYAFNLQKEDVVVVLSNSGYSKRLLTLIRGAKENGATVIAITNNPDSPIALASDYHIITATREKLLMDDFCFSRVSVTAVVEMLYLLIAANKKDAYKIQMRNEMAIADDKIKE